jgi:hypothetical protein
MKKKLIFLLLGLVVMVIIFIIVFLSFIDKNQNDILLSDLSDESSILLFTGETCPHCKDVETYIYNNNLLDKLDLSILEVYYNVNNAQIFEKKFNQCLLQPRIYGVPLLWHNQNCILGPVEIVNYLNNLSN